ncbi:MAG: hypothetical protein ACKO1J_18645 [Tagaea sp.]
MWRLLAVLTVLAGPALAQPSPEQMLRNMDTDGDGRISRQEWRGPPGRFDAIDANRDGYITLEELQAARQAGPPATSASVCDIARQASADPELWIDTQTHLRPGPQRAFGAAIANGLRTMDGAKIAATIVMPQPFPDEESGGRTVYDSADFAGVARAHPCRFAFLGGNGLNQMLARIPPGEVTEAQRVAFRREAQAVLAQGAAGFGQISLLHLARFPGHPFQETAPDHPMMLLLAEIAGQAGKPINVHMQIYERAGPPPPYYRGQNPPSIQANLATFERLLAHDRRARIVLANFGEDPSGQFTMALARQLLTAHPNLHFIATIMPARPGEPASQLAPFGPGGLSREWLALASAFPERFTVGSLSFHAGMEGARAPNPADIPRTRELLARLPPELRRKIAIDNALALYGLR